MPSPDINAMTPDQLADLYISVIDEQSKSFTRQPDFKYVEVFDRQSLTASALKHPTIISYAIDCIRQDINPFEAIQAIVNNVLDKLDKDPDADTTKVSVTSSKLIEGFPTWDVVYYKCYQNNNTGYGWMGDTMENFIATLKLQLADPTQADNVETVSAVLAQVLEFKADADSKMD